MTMNKFAFLLLLLGLINFNVLAGGGWTQPKGEVYLKFGQYTILADSYYTPSGDIIDITTTGYYATSAYAEIGITDKITGIIYFPFFVRSTLNELQASDGTLIADGDDLNSVGDVDVTVKYGFLKQGAFVGSVSLTLGLPLGNPAGGDTQLLQTGDGEFNQMITMELSKSFAQGKFYSTILAAFNNRTENFSDEFRYGLELGYQIKPVWLITRIYGVTSFKNGDDTIIANNGIFSNNLEYLSFSPEIAYNINDKMGISLGAGFAFRGKRVLADPSYSLGWYFNW